MKRLFSIVLVLTLLCSSLFTIPAYAVGDGNVDGGGGGMGDGTSTNSWTPGNEGVRVTVVRASDHAAVTTPIDLTNKAPVSSIYNFGKVSKLQYSGGRGLSPVKGGYSCVKPAQTMPRIISTNGSNNIAAILSLLDDLTKWANDIMTYAANAAINHGKQWNGFKVVEGRSNRKYADEVTVAEAAKGAGYCDIYKKSLIPLTEMERLMGKEKFTEVLGGLIQKPRGKLTLVPISDKRPTIEISNVNDDFKEDI